MNVMFRFVRFRCELVLPGLLVAATGCVQELDLEPVEGAKERVADRAEHWLDIDLPDEQGDSHAARIYYSANAGWLAESLAETAVVLLSPLEFDEVPAHHEEYEEVVDVNDPATANEEASSERPWAYVRIGTLGAEGIPLAWTAPYSAFGITNFGGGRPPVNDEDQRPDESDDGYLASANYDWWLSTGGETFDGIPYCNYGASYSQLAFTNSYGDGRVRMKRDSTWHASWNYYEGSSAIASGSGHQAADWEVRNEWRDGFPVGGNGNLNCN